VKHTSQTPAAARSGQHSVNLQMPAWPRSSPDLARLARSGPNLASAGQLPDCAAGGRRRPGLNRPSPPPSLPTRAALPVDGPSPRHPRRRTAAARELESPPSLTRLHLREATTPSRSRPRRRALRQARRPRRPLRPASSSPYEGEKGGPITASARALPGGGEEEGEGRRGA
jgi:hypothetical protein